MKNMKVLCLATMFGCIALSISCSSNEAAGGNQEAKRRAALARHQQEQPIDQSHANLLNAQDNRLDRDSNPMRSY
jgi:hypothetical protein